MSEPSFQRIGVAANLMKPLAVEILGEFVPHLVAHGFQVFLDGELNGHFSPGSEIPYGIPDDIDLLVAVGGDGTILKYANLYEERETPILGLKGGTLGFLTEGRTDKVADWLRESRYRIQRRMRIQCTISDGRQVVSSFSALNDVVVHGSGFSRMVTVNTQVDGKLMREYNADGVIVATPTGSTAYSLSAGGPLLEPTIQAMILTPLAPHTMSVRPLVVDAEQKVSISVKGGSDIIITIDGQDGSELTEAQRLEVKRSARYTRLVVPEDYDFLALLREKL